MQMSEMLEFASTNIHPWWRGDDTPEEQLKRVIDTFAASRKQRGMSLWSLRYLPFDQIDEDPARYTLDRTLVVKVLRLPNAYAIAEFGGPLDILRRKLAREPQIHGGKKSRVVFDPDGGEHNERRYDRDEDERPDPDRRRKRTPEEIKRDEEFWQSLETQELWRNVLQADVRDLL